MFSYLYRFSERNRQEDSQVFHPVCKVGVFTCFAVKSTQENQWWCFSCLVFLSQCVPPVYTNPLSSGVGGGSGGVFFLLVRSSVSLSVCSPCLHKPLNPLPPSPMSPLTKPKSQRCSVHQTGKTNIWATTEESLNPRVKPARVCVWSTIAIGEGSQVLRAGICDNWT